MNFEQKALRLSAAVLTGAILLRLLSGIPDTAVQALAQPQLAQLLIFLQTGRMVSLDVLEITEPAAEIQMPDVTGPAKQAVPAASFTAEDAQLVELRNTCGYDIDVQGLLTQPLNWDLTENSPSVLILHTHGTESYTGTDGFRSQDETKNMLAIGDRLKALLEAGGIGVIHDRTLHDADSYNGSYAHARTSMEEYLKTYPSIRLVLDVHRDSAEDDSGNQIDYVVPTKKGNAAKLMLVMGTDAGGLSYPDWQTNLSLAVKLHAAVQKLCPEICRPLYLRTSRFNQDLSPGALLVEVGAAGNTQQEALLAAEFLAQGILELAHGANI